MEQTISKGIQERLDKFSNAVVLPIGRVASGLFIRNGLYEPILASGAIDIDDMAGESVHGGNGRLPVSRLEHVDHTGREASGVEQRHLVVCATGSASARGT